MSSTVATVHSVSPTLTQSLQQEWDFLHSQILSECLLLSLEKSLGEFANFFSVYGFKGFYNISLVTYAD